MDLNVQCEFQGIPRPFSDAENRRNIVLYVQNLL